MPDNLAAVATPSDIAAVKALAAAREALLGQIGRRVVGQHEVIDQLLIALFARGHCLFVGVPGLAKTLLISTLADVLDLRFNRIQFTPDLMPSDITGTDVLEEDRTTGKRAFRFVQGPLFANIVLADEINRTPPKTQAALLQAMQEYRVTAGGRTYPLEQPFLVFATQNPIEQEGTYPLPEAQLDRFMFLVDVGYPSAEEEIEIVRSTDQRRTPRGATGAHPRRDPAASGARPAGPGGRPRHSPRGRAGAPIPSQEPRRSRFRRSLPGVGGRATRLAVPGARRQGPRHFRRAASRRSWRTYARWPGRFCATD